LDVRPSGAIKINYPDKEPWELEHTCSLDLSERGGMTLEEVGEVMNITRERARQIESRAKRQLGEHAKVLR
jgi:DNA-directed RNA polymerase sigma subunit (sigma70/sigma32)